MAIVLGATTEAILDRVLRSLNADTLRLASVPVTAEISGRLQAATVAGTTTTLQVDNGHLWPKTGYVRLISGTAETVQYTRVSTPNGNKAPAWDGIPPTPTVRLHLVAATVNVHAAQTEVYLLDNVSNVIPARVLDSGLLGAHDMHALVSQLLRELTSGTFTATGGSTTTAVSAGMATPYVANTQIGNTITIATGAAAGETATITGNTVNTLTFTPALSAVVGAGDTYTITQSYLDDVLDELAAAPPVPTTGTTVDTSTTPSIFSDPLVDLCSQIINRYGGTEPTSAAARSFLAQTTSPTTILTETALNTDTVITVQDASILPDTGNIIIGTTAATIFRNNAGDGGQGPNTITLTAALGGAGEAIGAEVHENPRASTATGMQNVGPSPMARSTGFIEWVLAAIAAVEAYTLPAS